LSSSFKEEFYHNNNLQEILAFEVGDLVWVVCVHRELQEEGSIGDFYLL